MIESQTSSFRSQPTVSDSVYLSEGPEETEPLDLDAIVERHALCDIAQGDPNTRLKLFGFRGSADKLFSLAREPRLKGLSKPKLAFDFLRPKPPSRSRNAKVEGVVDLECTVGPPCASLRLSHPVMTFEEIDAVKLLHRGARQAKVLDTTLGLDMDMEQRLLQIAFDAKSAVEEGFTMLVLSDRRVSESRMQVPSLLAVGAVHRMLSHLGLRNRAALFIETGEARTTHHFSCLFAYGADGVHSFLAQECLVDNVASGANAESASMLIRRYREALEEGIAASLKKRGFASLEAFKKGQMYEAVGLAANVVSLCLPNTPTKLPKNGFTELKNLVLSGRSTR